MNIEENKKTSVQSAQRKGRFVYTRGQWYWVPNKFNLVYKKINFNGKNIRFPFGFRIAKPERCELN